MQYVKVRINTQDEKNFQKISLTLTLALPAASGLFPPAYITKTQEKETIGDWNGNPPCFKFFKSEPLPKNILINVSSFTYPI